MLKISVVVGTRPEAVKLAPVIRALRREPGVCVYVCAAAQHREMLDAALNVFNIRPDTDLNLMVTGQTLGGFTARALATLDSYCAAQKPDWLIVQGDTATAFSGALAAFYQNVRVAHVEAGLRTGDFRSPWPEECYRTLLTRLASLHFAPTVHARENLLRENVAASAITVTGNTVVDALLEIATRVAVTPPTISSLPSNLQPGTLHVGPRMVLVTSHRREHFGRGIEQICAAICDLAGAFPATHFVYPVHLNPNVCGPVNRIIGEKRFANIHLIPPLDYVSFVALLIRSYFVLTDSGGIQEEAPSLKKPVLVMRDNTERPEAIKSGVARIAGAKRESIVRESRRLLEDSELYAGMAAGGNPYGDGQAASRIVRAIMNESFHPCRCKPTA